MKSGIFIDVADLCSRKVSTKKGHYRAFPTTLITGDADCKSAGSDSVLYNIIDGNDCFGPASSVSLR
jgi:hypothetical protein